MKPRDVFHRASPTWCRGCGLFGVFDALKRAAAALDLEPENIVIVTGIGCHGRLNNYFYSYGFHGLHGRTLPVATGIKLANPRLQVIVVSGDGDAYSIGGGHFLHAVRRNIDLTVIVVNNRIYALTQGQASPTTEFGRVTISTPFGSKEFPIDGPTLALAAGGTFVARGFSGNPAQLATLFEKGMKHQGFALIDVLSPCVTHNKVNTYDWYRSRSFPVESVPGYDPRDRAAAREMVSRQDEFGLGVLYLEDKPSFDRLVIPDPSRPLGLADLSVDRPRLQKIMEKFR